jgi:polysaccharide biosynthesis transport protein
MSDRSQLPPRTYSAEHEMLMRADDKAYVARYPYIETRRAYATESNNGDSDFQAVMQVLQVLFRHKLALLVSLLIGGVVAVAASLYATPMYRARTTMQIETQHEPFAGNLFSGQDPTLVTQSQLLSSKSLRDRAAAKLRASGVPKHEPYLGTLTSLRKVLRLQEPAEAIAWEEAVDVAAGKLAVNLTKESRIVTIQADSVNPQAAAAYANTLAEEYIEQNAEQRWEAYQNTGDWLDRAQNELKAKLEKSEQQLLDYQRSAGLLFTSDTQNISEEKLKNLQTQLAQASGDRIAKQSVYESSLSSPEESLPEVLDSGPMAQYQVKLADLRREYAQLSVNLTPENPKVKQIEAQINEVEVAREKERSNIIKRIRIEYEAAQRRESALQKDFGKQTGMVGDEAQKLIYYSMLKREVETNRELYKTTLQKGKEASLASAMRTNNARIVDRARVPRLPQQPNVPLNVALGSMGGLFCGAVFVIVRARSDVKIQSPDMLGSQLSLRELGVIPSAKTDPEVRALARRSRTAVGGKAEGGNGGKVLFSPAEKETKPGETLELATFTRNRSILAEAFRAAMTSILFSGQSGERPQVLLITSPSPQEGKSTVTSNLAIALAEIGRRVVIIDGDMRLPRLHTIFDVPNTFGLSDILSERSPVEHYSEDTLVRKSSVPGLHVIPAGPARTNLSRLLYSSRVKELVERLRLSFDIILIDSPPVLSVPDARILALVSDGVVLVVRAHKTHSTAAAAAAARFEEDGRRVLGTILNDWNPSASGSQTPSYYNPYSSYYRTSRT